MGRLLSYADFEGDYPTLNPSWYFPKARRSRSSGRWEYDAETAFPHKVHIHRDQLESLAHGDLRVAIRKFVERQLQTDVYWCYKNLDYNKPSGFYVDRIVHGYFVFMFETEADAVMFALAFGEIVTRHPSPTHPSHGA